MRRCLMVLPVAVLIAACTPTPEEPIVEMLLADVPAGTYSMGWAGIAEPVHDVTLSVLSLGRYEVTFEQWTAVREWAIQADPVEYGDLAVGMQGHAAVGSTTPDHPVTQITWYDAVLWCNALSDALDLDRAYTIDRITKDPGNLNSDVDDPRKWTVTVNAAADGFRLPTEAEFEYAARYIDVSTMRPGDEYSGSATADDVAWYMDNADTRTHAVGTKAANELGLFDLSGNVHEWLWDWAGVYGSGTQADPLGPTSGTERKQRGGAWENHVDFCRCSDRGGGYPKIPTTSDSTVGLRVCR